MAINKQLKIILSTIIISFIITLTLNFLPDFIGEFPSYGLIASLSIFGGPYAAIGVFFATLIAWSSSPFDLAVVNAVSAFIITYFTYKLWYSYTKSSGFIYLDSIYNFLKLIGVILLSSILFNYLDIFYFINIVNGFNYSLFGDYFIISMLNFSVLTLIIVGIILIILNYFNISLYYPGKINLDLLDSIYDKFNNFKFINHLNNYMLFDYSLISIIILSVILTIFLYCFNLNSNIFYLLLFILIILMVVYIFRPLDNKDYSDINEIYSEFKSFSLTEVLIILFFVILICLGLLLFVLYSFGYLTPIWKSSNYYSFLYYFNSVILFLIPFIGVLWYVEKRVTGPINKISKVLNGYFKGGISKEDRYYLQNMPKFLNHESEVGVLARVLSQMSMDLDEYIENIQNLTAEKERINSELAIAHDIQTSFLSKDFDLDREDLDIYAVMNPAKSVGGDFYDFFMIDDNHFAFLIADVSDKGVPAALFMAKSKQIIQSYILSQYLGDSSLEDIVYEINNNLSSNNDSCMFVTFWVGIIDLKNSKLRFINAGHESPIIKSKDEYKFLESDNDLVLGIMKDIDFHSHVIDLDYGDRILLYTDGVTDSNNENGEFFGKDNLLKAVKENDLDVVESINGIIDSVNNFTKKQEQFDDFTMLLVEYHKK